MNLVEDLIMLRWACNNSKTGLRLIDILYTGQNSFTCSLIFQQQKNPNLTETRSRLVHNVAISCLADCRPRKFGASKRDQKSCCFLCCCLVWKSQTDRQHGDKHMNLVFSTDRMTKSCTSFLYFGKSHLYTLFSRDISFRMNAIRLQQFSFLFGWLEFSRLLRRLIHKMQIQH